MAQGVQEDALSHIIEDKKDCYTVFNASGWKRSEIVTIPNERAGIYRDEQGNELDAQQAGTVTYVEVKDIPAMGTGTIIFEEKKAEETEAEFTICGKTSKLHITACP